MNQKTDSTAVQYQVILSMVQNNASILDLGCGDGELMERLAREKNARTQGIEIEEEAIYKCVARGLSVLHGDIDTGLAEYGYKSFDFVILNHSFQQVKKPEKVLNEALRVGKKVIVGFPNFAHFSVRFSLGIRGRTPVTPSLPFQWYNTPNLHFLSISDFARFCRENHIQIEVFKGISKKGQVKFQPNFFAESGMFLINMPER